MKILFYFLFILNISICGASSTSYAQTDSNDDFLTDMADNDLSDEEEIDFETDEFMEQSNSSSAFTMKVENTNDLSDLSGEENETKEELQLGTAESYQTFGSKTYNWSLYVHYGFQFANVSENFSFADPLPNEYTDIGLDIYRHIANKPYFWGARFQMMSESVENSTVIADYKMNLLTALVGYKFIDDVVSISGTLGLVLPLSASSTLSSVSGSATTDKDLKIGLSYTVGLISVVKLKRFHLGFDGGIITLRDQKLDGADFDQNSGAYFRFLVGLAF